MPRRSTPFQKLVLHIQSHTTPGASVAESAMLRHRLTGQDREVDVVVRAMVGEHPVTISIECIDQGRPADVTWVEQIHAKHAQLETSRLVLVSRSGFSEQAQTLATQLGVATFTPEQACALEWTRVVGLTELFCTRYDFKPVHVSLAVDTGDSVRRIDAGEETDIQLPDTETTQKLRELVESLLRTPEFADRAMMLVPRDASVEFEIEFPAVREALAIDTAGRRHRIDTVHVRARCVTKTCPVPLASLSWSGLPVAFGQAQTALGATTVTFIEPQPGTMVGRVIVDGRDLDMHTNSPRGLDTE